MGSVTIELSIFIAMFCGLFYGFMAIENGIRVDIALQVAAREGAREYATTNNSARAKTKATRELVLMGVSGATINAYVEDNGRSVELKKQYNYKIPLFGSYNKELKGYCTFYVDN